MRRGRRKLAPHLRRREVQRRTKSSPVDQLEATTPARTAAGSAHHQPPNRAPLREQGNAISYKVRPWSLSESLSSSPSLTNKACSPSPKSPTKRLPGRGSQSDVIAGMPPQRGRRPSTSHRPAVQALARATGLRRQPCSTSPLGFKTMPRQAPASASSTSVIPVSARSAERRVRRRTPAPATTPRCSPDPEQVRPDRVARRGSEPPGGGAPPYCSRVDTTCCS